MKITIVIPVYNVAPYIKDCLASVMKQTYKGEIECLLIDDCGTDNSMGVVSQVLKDYSGKIDFRIYRHKYNRGLSAARNTGIEHATGEYIYFLDSDDEITSDCMEKLVTPLDTELYDFVIGGYQVIPKKRVPGLLLEDGTSLRGNEITKSYYQSEWYMMVCGKLCNVAFLRNSGLFFEEGLLHEDELWSFQLSCLAQSMYVVTGESYIYKLREGSITMNPKTQERRAIAFRKIINSMIEFVQKEHIKSEYAYLKVFSMLNTLNQDLPQWTSSTIQDQKRIIGDLRKELSRISYRKRLSCCMVSSKSLIRYGAVLLPAFVYADYNKSIDRLSFWLTQKLKK